MMKVSFQISALTLDWKLADITTVYKKGDKLDYTIPEEQYGFVRGKSTTTNLLVCINDWSKALDSTIPTDVIYFDFPKSILKE